MLLKSNKVKYLFKLTTGATILSLFVLPSLFQVYALTNTISHTSQTDFNTGTLASTLDTSISPGDIKLKQDKNVLTESSYDDFKSGQSLQNGTILNPSSGDSSIKLDKEVTSINNLHEPLLHYTFDEGSGKVIANTGSTPGSNGFLG